MSKDESRTYMPAGIGGLMRFGEEEEPLVKIQPKHVIFIIVGVVAIELIAKLLVR